jgi:hypothetical protein
MRTYLGRLNPVCPMMSRRPPLYSSRINRRASARSRRIPDSVHRCLASFASTDDSERISVGAERFAKVAGLAPCLSTVRQTDIRGIGQAGGFDCVKERWLANREERRAVGGAKPSQASFGSKILKAKPSVE